MMEKLISLFENLETRVLEHLSDDGNVDGLTMSEHDDKYIVTVKIIERKKEVK